MNVYSFKTLEFLVYVGADNITDALSAAEKKLDSYEARKNYNAIVEVNLIASDLIIAGKVV